MPNEQKRMPGTSFLFRQITFSALSLKTKSKSDSWQPADIGRLMESIFTRFDPTIVLSNTLCCTIPWLLTNDVEATYFFSNSN